MRIDIQTFKINGAEHISVRHMAIITNRCEQTIYNLIKKMKKEERRCFYQYS